MAKSRRTLRPSTTFGGHMTAEIWLSATRGTARSLVVRAGLVAGMVVPMVGVSAAPALAASRNRSFTVVAREFRFSGVPKVRTAGTYHVTFINRGKDDHDVVAVNLGPQCSTTIKSKQDAKNLKRMIDKAGDAGAEAAFAAACPGGGFEGGAGAGPGKRDREDFKLTQGKTLYFCAVTDEHGAHSDLGMIGFITVREAED